MSKNLRGGVTTHRFFSKVKNLPVGPGIPVGVKILDNSLKRLFSDQKNNSPKSKISQNQFCEEFNFVLIIKNKL